MEKSIIVSNVSKKYKLYKDHKNRLLDLISPKNYGDDFYALENVSFEADKGDIIGIVGINGSGKSTLSNIIAGIVPETSGEVHVNGETSIIAVAAGLKGDLTGRDNIELKCLMLGFSKNEIKKLESSIIEFSELDDFIDQPVKSYSSGMKSRLGFAISVNVDPDILIIDEALSVGDQAFADKSFNKMMEFKEEGKTMIFVSHSIGQMKKFCEKILWLEFGRVKLFGKMEEVLPKYESFLGIWKNMSAEEREVYMQNVKDNQQIYLFETDDEEQEVTFKKTSISRMCRLKNKTNPYIYKFFETIGKESIDSKKYVDSSFYSKRQVEVGKDKYFLLGNKPSGVEGIIGWVASSEVESHLHIEIDEDIKYFKFTGTGIGYNRPWGGKKNIIISDFKDMINVKFKAIKTEKIGKNIWYYGEVKGEMIWIHEGHLSSNL